MASSEKPNFWITFILSITPLVGWIGIHRFYLGQRVKGLLYLLFFWTGIPPLVALIDSLILIIRGKDAFYEKHGVTEESNTEESNTEESNTEESNTEESNTESIEPDYSDYYGDFS